jgi:hypothetical protein
MPAGVDSPSFFDEIDLGGEFPDIDDVEGFVEQTDYYDRTKTERTYFYRLGNTTSVIFVPCADVDCEGAYYIRDILAIAYRRRRRHLEGALTCCVCKEARRRGNWCRAKFSIDVKYKRPLQEPRESPGVPSPEDRYDMY